MLYLTYDNSALTDGAGAQIQRIISIYLVAKHYGVGYVHQGIKELSYQGVQCLEKNEGDPSQIAAYNDLIALPSDIIDLSQNLQVFKVFDISEPIINEFKRQTKNTLLIIQFAGTLVDSKPEILQQRTPLTLGMRTSRPPIKIAIHVRRGELFVVDSDRMLPNSYYVECMEALRGVLGDLPHEFHLYTEQLSKPLVVLPSHHGICNRIAAPITVDPAATHLEDFAHLPIIYHINESPVETLKELASADVLLASRSSFSYVAAILKEGGVVLFHPFWHSLAPHWIPTRGAADILNAAPQILKAL
jgi:hypothetical protein